MPRRYPVFAPPTYGDPMVFTTTRRLIATRRATSLQTPLPRMPPTYGALWSLQRRGTPRRYVLREPELIDLNHFTLE